MKKYLLLFVLLLFIGCTQVVQPDGTTAVALDPNVVANIEGIIEGGGTTLVALTPLLGPLATLIGGIALGGLRTWRKLKPQLMEAKGKAEVSNAAVQVLVASIEALKVDYPTEWTEHLEPLIEKAITTAGLDPKVVENVIRGIRGLPPKG